MEIIDQNSWNEIVEANSDPYGSAAVQYAEKWASLMELKIKEGATVEEVAERTSHEADTEGITGHMYGFAVWVLSKVWKHGEQLRRWHNLKTQIGGEGERANESGGVLNPALLNIGEVDQ